jgi:hypothetical protein
MLDLRGRSVTGYQYKGKEGKIFGYSVLDTVKVRNGLVPDPERLPDIMKKHFTEKMADFVSCPWSEGQGGDLDGEHSDLLNHALTTLVGKQNDEAFGGNTMVTQWKQVKRITLSSVNNLEDLTTRLEDLRDSDTTLYQTVGTNLESVMLKAGYDEDLAREWVPCPICTGSASYVFSILWVYTLTCGRLLLLTAGAMQSCRWNNMLKKCVKPANTMGPTSKLSA